MTDQLSRRTPRAITILVAFTVFVGCSAQPAFAEYRAWFTQWDFNGDFQEGDISEDHVEMWAPDGACGLRVTDPDYYRWANTYEQTVTSGNLFKDVIIWIDRPGCSRPFSVRYYDDSHTFNLPAAGAAYLEILTDYGAHWVGDDGYYLHVCNACAGADDFFYPPPRTRWSRTTVNAFEGVGLSLLDPRRQSGVVQAIPGLTSQVQTLQQYLKTVIANRRRTTIARVEASVRGLEDAAVRLLADALKQVSACDTLARQGRYAEAFNACTIASQHVAASESEKFAAEMLYFQPKAVPAP